MQGHKNSTARLDSEELMTAVYEPKLLNKGFLCFCVKYVQQYLLERNNYKTNSGLICLGNQVKKDCTCMPAKFCSHCINSSRKRGASKRQFALANMKGTTVLLTLVLS
jgi:hypothetical protein